MPGDLWTGYLQAQAADVAEVEREEEKKKQRLQEQLQKLNMESLRRTIDRDAREWEIEDAARTGREEALSRLREFLPPEYMDAALTGIDLSDLRPKKEQEPWFIGTPHEERGLGKEFYIKPGAGGQDKWEYIKSLTAKDPANLTEEEERYLIGQGLRYDKTLRAWAKPKAGDDWSPIEKDVGFRFGDFGEEGGESSGEDLDAQILETQKEIRELLKKLK